MNNDELKKKICDIIAPYVSAYGDDERIADALIAAGIGDVETPRKIGAHATAMAVLRAAKAEYRAEVAERALLTACVNLIKDKEDNVNMELLARVVYTNYLRKSEKELAEGSNVKN